MSMLDLMSLGMFDGASPMMGLRGGYSQQLGGLRAMRYLHPYGMTPHMGRLPSSGGMNPFMAQMGGNSTQDYSQFTFDPAAHAAATQALAPYGIQPLAPNQANPFAIFSNQGFFGRHPRLTGALEGAITGAAVSRGADTVGEGISNVAQSMIQGPMLRHQLWEQQFAKPFQAASALGGLQDLQQKRELNDAMIQWHRAQVSHLKNGDEIAIDRINATAPRPVEGGAWKYDPNNKQDPWSFVAGPGGKAAKEAGIAPYLPYFERQGIDPYKTPPTKDQWDKAMKDKHADDLALAAQGSAARTHAKNVQDIADDTKEPVSAKNARTEQEKWEAKKLAFMQSVDKKPSFWKRKKIDPDNPNDKSDWYDKNYPPPKEATPTPTPSQQAQIHNTPSKDVGRERHAVYNQQTGQLE